MEKEKIILNISGMSCAACAGRIEKVLSKQKNIENINVNINTNKAFITYNKVLTPKEIMQMIEKVGYHAEIDKNVKIDHKKEFLKIKKEFIISLLFTLPIFLSMILHMLNIHTILDNGWVQLLLATVVQFYIGKRFYKQAYHSLKNGGANMDVLITLGTSAAYFYSVYHLLIGNNHFYFESSAMIITFVLLGKMTEIIAKGKTSEAIESLMKLAPEIAHKIVDNTIIDIEVNQLQIGDILLVKPGERIPIDGKIKTGSTSIDESMISGEAIPVDKKQNDFVYGATLNKLGAIEIEVTTKPENSVFARIVRKVEEATMSKAPIQRLADKISKIFVPTVLGISLFTFFIYLILKKPFDFSLSSAIAVLVIACPCALGLATPTAIMVGTGRGAKLGILIKNGEYLEKTHKLATLLLDKTGTITNGKPKVTKIIEYNANKEMILMIAGSIERFSEHPLASAIVEEFESKKIQPKQVSNFQSFTGKGIAGIIEDTTYYIGTRKFMIEHNIEIMEIDSLMQQFEQLGQTTLILANSEKILGLIVISDTIKDTTSNAIKQLKKLNIKPIMITGDNYRVAATIAKEVGIEEYYAEVFPEEKGEKVQALKKDHALIGMVGDGINDALALSLADVGFAMGSGSDIAIESSDITIISDNLETIVLSIKLSKKTMRIIKQNLFFAFIYNIIGIPIAVLGLLNPMVAGLAMAFSSVSVVLNSLRLKKIKL